MEEAAAQAAAEAAGPAITDTAPADVLGLPVYPGARPLGPGISIATDEGEGYDAQRAYITSADYDAVLEFYRRQMPGAKATNVESASGRSSTLVERVASKEEVVERMATLSESSRGTEIVLSAVGGVARFAVYLISVPPDAVDAAVAAICEWRGIPEEAKAAETQAEEVQKIMTVLPRPVEPELTWAEASELSGILEGLGCTVQIRGGEVPVPSS